MKIHASIMHSTCPLNSLQHKTERCDFRGALHTAHYQLPAMCRCWGPTRFQWLLFLFVVFVFHLFIWCCSHCKARMRKKQRMTPSPRKTTRLGSSFGDQWAWTQLLVGNNPLLQQRHPHGNCGCPACDQCRSLIWRGSWTGLDLDWSGGSKDSVSVILALRHWDVVTNWSLCIKFRHNLCH